MITDSYDSNKKAIIQPDYRKDRAEVEACIVTFSHIVEKYALDHYPCRTIGKIESVTGTTPIYQIEWQGKKFAFFKTYIGAPATVGLIEEALTEIHTNRFVVFGGCGCLDREIVHGKVMIPTEAYRDEGTSYHYAPGSDYISIKNAEVVADFMEKSGLPFVMGKTWTTDAFYRETTANFKKRKAEGCLSVEMECSAVQAVCDFRNVEAYFFFTSGDLLDAPEWDSRKKKDDLSGTQHDYRHFEIALRLADFIVRRKGTNCG